jgi:hypothetical protein
MTGRWRQAFMIDAVGNAHDGHVGIPRGERLGKLVSARDDPMGCPEREAL